jgi:hypothetical protein
MQPRQSPPDDPSDVLQTAAQTLAVHVDDGGGCCLGCLQIWGRLVWVPCEQARWAHAVTNRYSHPTIDRDSGKQR